MYVLITALALVVAAAPVISFAPAPARFVPSRARALNAAAAGDAGSGPLRARLVGTGSAAPETRVTNDNIAEWIDTTDEWISSRTGIGSRHVLSADDPGLASLAARAAASALADAGVDAADVDLVIVATSSPDDLFGDAPTVAHAIGASKAVAFDLTAACSGFLFATVTASQFLHSGAYKTAVVVGGDALSRWVDWDDRNSCILFGDGAGAVVLQRTEDAADSGVLGFALHSDGGGHDKLQCAYNGARRDLATSTGASVTTGAYAPITMDGREVYKFATRRVPEVVAEALENAGLEAGDVDHLLLHQANIRIMEIVADRLGIPREKIITNLNEYGNTSAGSIPLALEEAVRTGTVKKGDVIATAGFGAGLSWGSAILRWG